MLAILLSFVLSTNITTIAPTPLPTHDEQSDFYEMFIHICGNETLYKSDDILSSICSLYKTTTEGSKTSTSEYITLALEIVSFLIGVVGVGYFLYLRFKKCRLQKQKDVSQDVDIEIQQI